MVEISIEPRSLAASQVTAQQQAQALNCHNKGVQAHKVQVKTAETAEVRTLPVLSSPLAPSPAINRGTLSNNAHQAQAAHAS